MAVLTAKGISRVALEMLTRSLVLVPTVTAVPGNEFIGPNGGTITVRVPQPGVARKQASAGAALTADDVTEVPVDVSLSHVYHLKNITDQELSYNLEDFARQVSRVQVAAVATGAEDELLTLMNGLAAEGAPYQFALTADDEDTKSVLLAAREALSKAKAPMSDRYLAVSPEIASRLLHLLTPVNEAGSSDALRDAIIGRIYGFNVVEAVGMDAGEAVAYHRSGFAFANRAPAQPKGATSSSVSQQGPFALRQIFQYDAGHAQDQSLVSTFAGAAAVYEDGTGTNGTDNKRFVKLDTSAT
jgi:hypothetical protein